jgi:formamidopyrimidine-DNA glycosylase
MPELPEVRAQAGRIDELFGTRELEAFRALSFTALKTFSPAPDAAIGEPLLRAWSRGKYLVLEFESQKCVIHLMQGGRLEPDPKESAKPRGGLARWDFADAGALLFSEQSKEKRAGIWVVLGDLESQEPVEGLGPDADQITISELTTRTELRTGRLHGFLRDQREIAGLGRRLANEICHRAELSPFAKTSKLSDNEISRLHAAINAAIDGSMAYEDEQDHMTKSKERPSRVHSRTGEPCPVCDDDVRSVEYRSYTVNYCATCQTEGRVLADNTTSKFLR